MGKFYSPNGNLEVWADCPDGYLTPEEWAAAHPAPEPTFDELKTGKLAELDDSFKSRVSGFFVTSQGYEMQFSPEDSLKVEGAIRLMSATGQTSGYLTQANDMTVYDVPLETMQAVMVEMLAAYAACHARKQELRAQINAAQNVDELNAIRITWPV